MLAMTDDAAITARKGLRVRTLDGGRRSVVEVAEPGELERLRDAGKITPRQYDAGAMLRVLWVEGTLLPEPSSSGLARLEEPWQHRSSSDDISDRRLEINSVLREALRALGPARDWIVQVVIYDSRVDDATGRRYLRRGLDRLADLLDARPSWRG